MNPDFCAYANAFGGHGERVTTAQQFELALARARASGKPAILHCLLDAQALTPATTIDGERAKALTNQRLATG